MSELAEFLKRTGSGLHEMLAQLGLVLLLKCVELALVTIEIVIVALLSQMTQNLGRRIIKVAWSTILVTLVVSSLTFLGCIGGLVLLLNVKVHAFSLNWRGGLSFKRLLLLEIRVFDGGGDLVDVLAKGRSGSGRGLDNHFNVLFFFSLVHHLNIIR